MERLSARDLADTDEYVNSQHVSCYSLLNELDKNVRDKKATDYSTSIFQATSINGEEKFLPLPLNGN